MDFFDLKKCILENEFNTPTIFYQFPPILKWRFSSMTIEKLATTLIEKKLKFRVGIFDSLNVQWEGECQYIQATIKDFNAWIKDDFNCGPLKKFEKNLHWAYADYIYLKNILDEIPDVKFSNEIDWSKLGFSENEGIDTAIWIGSKGAYTVCHYDTYGYNLVVQISGRKRWILFPPSDTTFLYPTRIPYEESTVFSKVNVKSPSLSEHPRFASSNPHVIELEPGDVLFVPPKWWHFVENMEDSISVNAWFPCESDPEERIKEALTRLLIGSAINCHSSTSSDAAASVKLSSWINPTESSVCDLEGNLALLRNAVTSFRSGFGRADTEKIAPVFDPCTCLSEVSPHPSRDVKCRGVERYCFRHACQIFKWWNSLEDKVTCKRRRTDGQSRTLSTEDIVECLTSPTVINCFKSELEKYF